MKTTGKLAVLANSQPQAGELQKGGKMVYPKKLGVNVDHIATLRQARGTLYPDPVEGALAAQKAGADLITVHLREDRRHIQVHDIERLKKILQIPLNLEMACTDEMVSIAKKYRPEKVCLVPEKREELTTEGGLDVASQVERIAEIHSQLLREKIEVSLFIDPDTTQIEAVKKTGVPVIELHTGAYADAVDKKIEAQELHRLKAAAIYANQQGLVVNAGHGLNYINVGPIAQIAEVRELNIGHAIVAQALFVGITAAVKTMRQKIQGGKG